MSVSKQEVNHIVNLAHLQLGRETTEKFQKELSAILDYISKLDSVDTSNVEPLNHPGGITGAGRSDEVDENRELSQGSVLQNAPEKEDGYIKVKPVL